MQLPFQNLFGFDVWGRGCVLQEHSDYISLWLLCLHNSSCSIDLQANQTGSSSAMEFSGHQQAFAFLLGTAMIIKAFVSDRHSQIAKWMRVECPKKCRELGKPVIDHFFYLWHIGKSKLPNKSIHISIYSHDI